MKTMMKTLLALVLCLTLALPCAGAEGAYVQGATTRALFAEAWSAGQMITADLSVQMALNGEALGLSSEDMAQVNALTTLLDASTLRMGACRIDGGVRLLLAGLVKAQAGGGDVYADVAVDVTRAGLSIDSSLLAGRRVSVTWKTLLTMCDLCDEEIAMVLSLMDVDWDTLLSDLIEQAQPYIAIALQILAPYGETVAAWAQTLTIEQMADVEATADYPYCATLVNVYITEKDLGVLIKSLADQLAQDQTLCTMIDGLVAQMSDESYPGTAALCAQLSEASASLTDEEFPLILSLAMDEAGTPLYIEVCNIESNGTEQYAGLFFYPDAADPALYNYEVSVMTIGLDGNAIDGFTVYGTWKGSETDPLYCDLTMDMLVAANRAYVMGFSYAMNTAAATTAEGLPGMASSAEMSLSVEDGDAPVAMIMNLQSVSGLTSRGGEQNDVQETLDLYIGDESFTVTALGTMIVEPGEGGLTGSYSILESMPDMGIDRYGVQMLLSSADYVPAALTEIAVETASDATMNAVIGDVTTAAQQLLEQLSLALPADVLELVGEIAEAM